MCQEESFESGWSGLDLNFGTPSSPRSDTKVRNRAVEQSTFLPLSKISLESKHDSNRRGVCRR